MTLNLASANSYNRTRNYSADAIRVIQREVEATPTGSFNEDTVRRIFEWQQGNGRLRTLTPDGKMGPGSLGTMVAELNRRGRTADAVLLHQFPNVLPPGERPPAGAVVNPIVEFRAVTLVPINLGGQGAGFKMGGRFRVTVRLNPEVDCGRYEYRQFIKGTANVQQGTFTGPVPSLANWRPSGPLHDAKNDFGVPGGLQPHFTEDGEIVGGRTLSFGYRSAAPVVQQGIEDRYLPSQATGCEYRAVDTYGLSGIRRPRGLRVRLKLTWQGRVIDTRAGNRILDTRQWGVEKDDIIT